jgi:hypothetical protein
MNFIYPVVNGVPDKSRWLEIGCSRGSYATFYFQELCHPGQISSLNRADCSLDAARALLDAGGTMQITTSQGYVCFRVSEDMVRLELKGLNDALSTKCSVLRKEVFDRLKQLIEQANLAPVAVAL